MRKVICGYCKKNIAIDKAYVVKTGKRNKYYCNKEHSLSKTPKEIFYSKAFEVFGKTTSTVFFKEFNEISEVHGFEKMISYLEDNKQYLEKVMCRDFSSEYAKIRYFSAIFKNNLGDYIIKKPKEIKRTINIDTEPMVTKYVKKEKKIGMSDLLNDLLEGDD